MALPASPHATQVTASADVKAIGGAARILKLSISNTGTAGTSGWIEFRDAQSPAGDTGTLRYRVRFASTDEQNLEVDFPVWDGGNGGLPMPDGIRVVFNTVTNVEVWVLWEG